MASSCAICRKNMKNKNIKLFRAPADELKRQRWNESCGLILNKNSRICEKHFLRSDFINPPRDPMAAKSRLMPGAVPSVLCGSALREDEIDCRLKPEKKTEFPIDLNEIKQQVTIEPLIIETQRIRLDNIQSFCRTCLTSIAQHTVGNGLIFNVHKTKDLAKWITEYTQLKVERNDGYPKYSCQECYNKFENFNEFRTTCTESMLLLESVLNSNKSGEKDPIQLDTDTSSLLCEDECISSEKGEFIAEDEIIDPAEWWKLEIRRDDGVEIDKTDTEENEEVVETKLENIVVLEKDFQQNIRDHMQTLESDDFESTTEFLETGNFPSEDTIKLCADEETSNDSLLNKMFPNNQQIIETLAKSSGETQSIENSSMRLECELCQKRCRNEKSLEAHLRVHQGLKPYQCSYCDQACSTDHNLRRHIRIVHKDVENDAQFICPFEGCEKRFHVIGGLRTHYRIMHLEGQAVSLEPVKLFICDVCGLNFKTSKQFKMHSFRHGPKEEYPYKCEICDRCFVSGKNFRDHQMRHEGIKNHVCPYCGVRKTTRGELAFHINTHTKAKQWPCTICGRVFYKSGNLRKHDLLFHKRVRNYKCSHCGQCFGKSDSLKSHEMRHTGERPHECQICHKRFAARSTLRYHMRTHVPKGDKDDIRNFKCTICEKSFRTLNVLQNHELIHTGEKPHKCQKCGKCFRQISALRYHLSWHEREDGLGSTGLIKPGTYRKKRSKKEVPIKEEQLEADFATLVTNVHVD